MSRADQAEHKRVPVMLFVDEFKILFQARHFRLFYPKCGSSKSLYTPPINISDQLDEATASAIWGNVGTIVAFRLGMDAEMVAEQMGGGLMPNDLRNLRKHHAYGNY